jgi:hypothetical protein
MEFQGALNIFLIKNDTISSTALSLSLSRYQVLHSKYEEFDVMAKKRIDIL